jgi:hypothetical protein
MGQDSKKLGNVISIDQDQLKDHVSEVVRSTVEETLNGLLDAEADRLCNASRYERSDARKDTRAGSYQRKLGTQAGEVSLKVPKLSEAGSGAGSADAPLGSGPPDGGPADGPALRQAGDHA